MMSDDRLKQRDELLQAVLPHVPFDGWTATALRHGTKDAGIGEADAKDSFPGGAAQMVEHFSDWSDRRMLKALEEIDLDSMGMTARVRTAVEVRLRQAEPYREAVARSIAFLALPQNAMLGAKLLYRTVDAIWHAAGDTSTDWNFYSKRGLLAGVFSSTVLYWLNDSSEDYADTMDFLDRRLRDVAAFGKATAKFKERFSGFPRPYRPYRR
jgi:ubiquinone biosynthesis protein COQ9